MMQNAEHDGLQTSGKTVSIILVTQRAMTESGEQLQPEMANTNFLAP
jgi:hypothetical protein